MPYSATPRLLREKHLRYSITLGEVRSLNLTNAPLFAESTLQYGLNNYLTAYTGLQILDNNKFQSELLGVAVNTPIGAVSLDTTWSHSQTVNEDRKKHGYSIRGIYSRNFIETGTNFAFTSYRYSSKGYSDINSFFMAYDSQLNLQYAEKKKLQLTLTQKLAPEWGNLNVNGSYTERWNGQKEHNYQLSYSNNYKNLYYSLTVAQTRSENSKADSQLFLNISAPLGATGSNRTLLTNTLSHSKNGRPSMQLGIAGNNSEKKLDYRVATTLTAAADNKLDGNLTWQSPFNSINFNSSLAKDNKRAAVNIKGGALLHSNGVTLAPSLGETIALVHVPNGKGAKVGNSVVNADGYAIATNLSPYKKNTVTVNPGDTSLNLEIERPIRQVIPSAGATVAVKFATKLGYSLLIKPTFNKAPPYIPMGSVVVDAEDNEVGVVGQQQYIFARVSKLQGRLSLQTSDGQPICALDYKIPEYADSLLKLTLPCE